MILTKIAIAAIAIFQTLDVLVVGGGTGGTAAAIQAVLQYHFL
ncbi:hypothetical protein [Nostoc sp.]